MTTKRKAELQRRLSMASVPKPPTGLGDRIKAEIPDLLGTTRERERLSSSITFSLRVAASIILLISSVYLSMQLLSRADRTQELPSIVALKHAPALPPARNSASVTLTVAPAEAPAPNQTATNAVVAPAPRVVTVAAPARQRSGGED